MKVTPRGLALISVLMLLEVVVLLGLYALQSGVQEAKISREYWQKFLMVKAAHQIVTQIQPILQTELPPCVVPITPRLSEKSLDWWKSASCAGNFQVFQYYYVVEKMGEDPCAYINQRSSNIIADYVRLSLLLIAKSGSTNKIIMQSTLVKPKFTTLLCKENSHAVIVGQQSWRELI